MKTNWFTYGNSVISYANAEGLLLATLPPPHTHKYTYNQIVRLNNTIKVTLDMSAVNPACRTVEMYMFQDVDDSQLHIYMPTQSFINYFQTWGFQI